VGSICFCKVRAIAYILSRSAPSSPGLTWQVRLLSSRVFDLVVSVECRIWKVSLLASVTLKLSTLSNLLWSPSRCLLVLAKLFIVLLSIVIITFALRRFTVLYCKVRGGLDSCLPNSTAEIAFGLLAAEKLEEKKDKFSQKNLHWFCSILVFVILSDNYKDYSPVNVIYSSGNDESDGLRNKCLWNFEIEIEKQWDWVRSPFQPSTVLFSFSTER